MAECRSARMSKITNDGLIRSGTGCFVTVPVWQHGRQRVKDQGHLNRKCHIVLAHMFVANIRISDLYTADIRTLKEILGLDTG